MSEQPGKYLLAVVGPTASGKTTMAIELANWLDTEIISADSRQVFKELEIGTAKPTAEEMAQASHHFINHCSITEPYDVGRYERDVLDKLTVLYQRRDVVIIAGGSGLYCKAVWEGLDEFPEIDPSFRAALKHQFEEEGLSSLLTELVDKDPAYYAEVDRQNPQRVIRALEVIRATGATFTSFRQQATAKERRPFQNIKIGLELPREVLYQRIDQRMDEMIAKGLFEEARAMLPYRAHNALQTVGYKEIFGYFDGAYDPEEAIRLLKRNSRRYAKRQLTWFKKDDEIRWYAPQEMEKIKAEVSALLDA